MHATLAVPVRTVAINTAATLTLLEPQSRFWGQTSQIPSSLSPKRDCDHLKPFRAAVPFWDNWGQITWNLGGLSPKRDCSSQEG